MRDKVIAISAVAIAGVAVAVGLTIGALGGAFDSSDQKVQPPALRSDLSAAVSTAATSAITVPPSPTWQVAVPTTPKPTTIEPTTTSSPKETTSRSPRGRQTTTEERGNRNRDDESTDDATTTTR